MSKWSCGNATLVTEILFTATLGISTEIHDDAQINNKLCTFSNFI